MPDIIKHNEKIIPLSPHPSALIRYMMEIGICRDKLLSGTNIGFHAHRIEQEKISYSQYAALICNAKQLSENPALGLYFGRRLGLNLHGNLGAGALASTSIYEALSFITKYKSIISPVTHLSLESHNEDRDIVLSVEPSLDSGELLVFFQETILSCLYFCGMKITRKEDLPVYFNFSYPEPPYVTEYRSFLNDRLQFSASRTELRYCASMIDASMPMFISKTQLRAKEDIRQQHSEMNGKQGLLTVIRQQLKNQNSKLPTLELTAESLHTSASALKRMLAMHNTTYQLILDSVRKELACTYLMNDELSIAKIAQHLHFSHIANFRRSFKRWTGYTPQEYRKLKRR